MIRLALAAAIVLASAPALADEYAGPVPDKARALAVRGRQLQHTHDYVDAIEAYKAAYVLAPSPSLLYDLAQVYRLAGDCADATWMYRRFLKTDPAEDLRLLAQDHLAKLATCDPGFRVALEPVPAPEPEDAVTRAPIERHGVVSDRGSGMTRTGVWLVGGGAASLAIAGLFALDAHAQQQAVDDTYHGNAQRSDVASLDARGRRDATAAAIFGVTGGVAALSGVALYLIGRHYESTAQISVNAGSSTGAVGVRWQF